MDNLQIFLPKQTNSTNHLLSCFFLPPPPPAADEYCPPAHHSSPSLLRNNSSIAHQELNHNAPITSTQVSPLNPTFPSFDSGQPELKTALCVPVSCKLTMAAAMSRNSLLASLSAGEAMDNIPPAQEFAKAAHRVQPRAEDTGPLNVARMEQGSDIVQIKKELQKQKDEAGSGGSATTVKRRYRGGEAAEEEGNQESGAALHGGIKGGNWPSNTGAGAVKKHKSTPPAPNVPRCQAEDCRIDLSNVKDYHRRHKVCEGHAKCSKVKVANLEQRFCQQCSRFHVLSEFDEGKRSCRRRLAGHNERRRKQQLEPFSLASYAQLAGAKCFFGPSFRPRPYLSNSGDIGADLQVLRLLQESKERLTESNRALELHKFMQGSQMGEEHLVIVSSAQAFVSSGGNDIDLTSAVPPALLTTLAHAARADHPQPVPETSVSGRALSLLSSSLGFPNTFNCVSPPRLGVSSSPSLHGHVLQNQHVASQQAVASCFAHRLPASVMEVLPHCHNREIVELEGHRRSAPCIGMNGQHSSSILLSSGGSSSFSMVQEGDVQGEGNMQSVAGRMQGRMQAMAFTTPQRREHHHLADMEGSLSVFGRPRLL